MKLLFFLIFSIPFFVAIYFLYSNLKKMISNRDTALKKRDKNKLS